MESTPERILDILREKGKQVMLADLREVEALIDSLPPDERAEVEPWIWEGLALTVNDPLYEGDIPPIE